MSSTLLYCPSSVRAQEWSYEERKPERALRPSTGSFGSRRLQRGSRRRVWLGPTRTWELMTELVPRPIRGRQYSHDRQVRLSDAGPDGVLRLDGAARYLQDAASDDWAASGLDNKELWVVRHTVICVAEGGRWPELGEKITVTTWCSGIGPAWAERRTDFEADDGLLVRAVALWVSLDPSGRPLRLKQAFQDIYGEAAGGRRVSGRVAAAPTHVAAPHAAVAHPPGGPGRRRPCQQRGSVGCRDRGGHRHRIVRRPDPSRARREWSDYEARDRTRSVMDH